MTGKFKFSLTIITKVNHTRKFQRKWTQRYEKIARETMKTRENTDKEINFLCKLAKKPFHTTQQISLINISKTVDTCQKGDTTANQQPPMTKMKFS